MKKMTAAILFVFLTCVVVPVYGESYKIHFSVPKLSYEELRDGYESHRSSDKGFYFDINGTVNNDTTDYFYGEFYDDFYTHWTVEGTIIWNQSFTKGRIQGTSTDDNDANYIDGTIRKEGDRYTLSVKGGISDYHSYIITFPSIKGTGQMVE